MGKKSTTSEKEDKSFPLAEMVDVVARELLEAQSEAEKRSGPVMQFEECEMTFAVTAQRKAGGALKLYVVNLSGESQITEQNTVRIKFTRLEGEQKIVAPSLQEGEAPRPDRSRRKKQE